MPNRSLTLLVAVALAAVACGGEGSANPTTSTAGEIEKVVTTTRPDGQTTSTTEVVRESGGSAPDSGTGTATVGDMTWDFELLENDGRSICMTEGVFLVSMFGVDQDGREVSLTINTTPSGGEAAVTAGDPTITGERWIADSVVYENLSGIEGVPDGVSATAVVDGDTVTGSGLFYEDRRLNEVRATGDAYDAGVLEGTFEATCPTQ